MVNPSGFFLMEFLKSFARLLDGIFRDQRLCESGQIDWRKCWFFLPILTPFLCLIFGPQYLDDAFITFRVSRNLVDFGVPYYNVGEVAQASTTPLYSLLLAAGYALTGFAPHLVENALQIPLLTATIILLSLISLRIDKIRPYWWLAGFFFSIQPILIVQVKGMEAYLYGALILLAVYAELKRAPLLLGIALGLCAVTRTEGALFGLCYVVCWLIQRFWFAEKRPVRELWLATGTGILTGLPFLAYVIWFFGDPIPTSVRGKAHQAGFVALEHFDRTMQYYLVGQYPTFNIWFIPLTAFVGLVMGKIVVNRDAKGWENYGFLSLSSYGLMGLFFLANAPAFSWYLYPSIVLFTLIYAHCFVLFAEHLRVFFTIKEPSKKVRTVYVLPMMVIILYAFTLRGMGNAILLNYVRTGDYAFMSDVRYGEIARELWQDKPDQSLSLGAPEIGHLGYFTAYRIIDFSALASPELIEDAGRISYYEMALKHQPDFIVIPEDLAVFENNPALREQFSAAYPRSKVYDAAHLGERTVYWRAKIRD